MDVQENKSGKSEVHFLAFRLRSPARRADSCWFTSGSLRNMSRQRRHPAPKVTQRAVRSEMNVVIQARVAHDGRQETPSTSSSLQCALRFAPGNIG